MRLRGEKFYENYKTFASLITNTYKVKDCKLGGRYWLVGVYNIHISDTYGVQILKNDGKQQKVFANEWSSLITCQK